MKHAGSYHAVGDRAWFLLRDLGRGDGYRSFRLSFIRSLNRFLLSAAVGLVVFSVDRLEVKKISRNLVLKLNS